LPRSWPMQRPRLAAKRRRCGGGAGDGPLAERIAGFLLNGYFFVALILYARLTVLWVWILSFTPLSRAYPFLALAFALTPALGCLVFAEPLRYGS
jgi:drug/metabolite transporter (DMT)-like permease